MAALKTSQCTDGVAAVGTDKVAAARAGANVRLDLDYIKTFCRYRAQALITGAGRNGPTQWSHNNSPIKADNGSVYTVYCDAGDGDIYFKKSTNDGVTHRRLVPIRVGNGMLHAVWYDGWTPGDTGQFIHVAIMDSTANTITYYSIDTANSDTIAGPITIKSGQTYTTATPSVHLWIMKTVAGNIICGWDGGNGSAVGCAKSDASVPTTFSGIDDYNDGGGATDYAIGFPANLADTNDFWVIYHDRSADTLIIRTYDDSLNTFSAGTNISTGIVDTAGVIGFCGAVVTNTVGSLTSGHLILLAWTQANLANADLKCWDITNEATVTAKTDVVTNSLDSQGYCGLAIADDTGELRAFFLGKSTNDDGDQASETAYTAWTLCTRNSTDGASVWSPDTNLTDQRIPITWLAAAQHYTDEEWALNYSGTGVGTTNDIFCMAYA